MESYRHKGHSILCMDRPKYASASAGTCPHATKAVWYASRTGGAGDPEDQIPGAGWSRRWWNDFE